MDFIFNLGGYDVYSLKEETCKKYDRVFPCLCCWYDSWDEEMDNEERTPDNSECEFENIQEAINWCCEFRNKRI